MDHVSSQEDVQGQVARPSSVTGSIEINFEEDPDEEQQVKIISQIFRKSPLMSPHSAKAEHIRLRFSDFDDSAIPDTEEGIREILGISLSTAKFFVRNIKEGLRLRGF